MPYFERSLPLTGTACLCPECRNDPVSQTDRCPGCSGYGLVDREGRYDEPCAVCLGSGINPDACRICGGRGELLTRPVN